ncbi:MAG: AAA family ATPase [Coleofasciculaceae cyanobacterium SM2_1_6]|nr:AAA family ATPase [Coleofasciculaceae cyanobacterium SM2_1_6]
MISPENLLQIAKGHSVTEGELEVLGAIVISGETITDVATRLKLQPEAVRKRLGEVYRKFGILGKGPGKLAKLQQLLMNNPVSNSKVKKTSSRKYASRNAASAVNPRSYGEQGSRLNADNLQFRSIVDFTKGEGISGDTLISDLEGYTGCVPDWDSAPDVEPFYGRQSELEQLKGWIAGENGSPRSRLVVLYGMGGIGKTFLAVKAGKELEKDFDAVVWRSIKQTPSLSKLIASIEDVINPGYISAAKLSSEESITRLINALKERRCLIILDDLDSIFDPNNVAGRYLPEFEAYSELIQRIATENHESSVLIVSRENIADIAGLEGNRVHTLQIDGSGEIAQLLVESQGLEYDKAWKEIATNFGGNPLALKIMITMIQDLYGGQAEDFLGNSRTTTAFFTFHNLLSEQFNRLSLKEKELMFVLAILQKASIAQIFNDDWIELSQSDLIEYMSSLRRRSLLERDKSEFSLQPMIWRHTVEKLIDTIENEMLNFLEDEEQSIENLDILRSYPWQQEEEDNQRFMSLLQRHFRTPVGKETLSRTLKILEDKYPEESGYAIDNLQSLVELAKV